MQRQTRPMRDRRANKTHEGEARLVRNPSPYLAYLAAGKTRSRSGAACAPVQPPLAGEYAIVVRLKTPNK